MGAGLGVPGALLITGGLSLGVYAIVRSETPAAAGAVLLILGFLLRQRRARRPLVPLRILGRRWLLGANAAVVLIFATGMGFQFVMALFLQQVMGYGPLGTGLAFLPTPIVIGLVSLLAAARLTGRFGPRPVLIAGLATLAAGLVMLWRVPAVPSYPAHVLPALVVMGLGIGVTIPAIIMLAMAGAAPADTGVVSGFGNTAQQAGGALGLSVLAAVAAGRAEALAGQPAVAALRGGYSVAFLVAAGFVLGALLLVVVALRRPPQPVGAPEAFAQPVGAPEALAQPVEASASAPGAGLAGSAQAGVEPACAARP